MKYIKYLLLLLLVFLFTSCTSNYYMQRVGTYQFSTSGQTLTRANTVTGEVEVYTIDGWKNPIELKRSQMKRPTY